MIDPGQLIEKKKKVVTSLTGALIRFNNGSRYLLLCIYIFQTAIQVTVIGNCHYCYVLLSSPLECDILR